MGDTKGTMWGLYWSPRGGLDSLLCVALGGGGRMVRDKETCSIRGEREKGLQLHGAFTVLHCTHVPMYSIIGHIRCVSLCKNTLQGRKKGFHPTTAWFCSEFVLISDVVCHHDQCNLCER